MAHAITPPCDRKEADFFDRGAALMRSAGFKLTPQRSAILDLFCEHGDHLTPQEVFRRLEKTVASLSLATVYNSLEVFEQVGIVTKFCAEHGQTYYDPNPTPHHHAVCERCEEIYDLELSESTMEQLVGVVQNAAAIKMSFRIQETKIWFRGVCDRCQ
ncbi:MAG: Fur family transcriptional regulator [Bradymonadaceae bacterium]